MRLDDLLNAEEYQAPGRETWLRALRETAPSDDGAKRWRILARIDDPDPGRAARQARTDLESGADGLALVFTGGPNAFGFGLPPTEAALADVLAALPAAGAALRLDTHPGNRTTVETLVAVLTRRRIDTSRLDLSLGIDPAAVFAGTGRLRMSIEALEASMPQSLAHFFTLGVPAILLEADGRVLHNAGAEPEQELGAMLASAVAYLRLFERARQPLVYAAPHIGFCLALDQDGPAGIAKLQALRALWRFTADACGLPPAPIRIHAETSRRMLAAAAPETNIVRNGAACTAAAAGGADSVAAIPHTQPHGLPDSEARRMALAMQLVLREECRIAGPAAGADAAALCEGAWQEFRRIEAEGGILRSLRSGRLQARVLEARDRRSAALAGGERRIVGTTHHALMAESGVATLAAERVPVPTEGNAFCQRLDAVADDELPREPLAEETAAE